MSEFLLLQDRVKNTIQLGESHFREFKSALQGPPHNKKPRPVKDICKDITEALVAFANADGGALLVGVEDDGLLSGLQHDENEREQMLGAVKSHVHAESTLPILYAAQLTIDGKDLLFFSVDKGSTEIYQLPDGRCMRRNEKTTMPVAFKQIQFDRQESKSREYDRQFVDGALVSDLDIQLVQSLADRYLRGLSAERYLQQVGLAEYAADGLRLRMAALLLFAKDIQRWHPRSQVRILKVNGTQLKSGESYNVQSDEIVRGHILDLLISSWERLRSFLAYKTQFGSDARFEQKYLYPESASREALINAIAHRDYHIQNGIEIFIFDDRMEIKSPGALLSTLTIASLEELQGAHESRNVLIAKVLRENEYMRELGEGIKRIFELMEENELSKPKLYSNSTWFSVALSHKSVFNDQQERFLSLYDSLHLTSRQKRIVALGIEDKAISRHDIERAMNTEDRDTYDNEVTGLRKAGVLEEIRTNRQAHSYEHIHHLRKGGAPRFKIKIPQASNQSNAFEHKTARHEVRTFQKNIEQKTEERTIFIASIPVSASPQEIRQLFEQCGAVESVKLPENQRGFRKSFGFVTYEKPEAASRAIKELNGASLKGSAVIVEKSQSKT